MSKLAWKDERKIIDFKGLFFMQGGRKFKTQNSKCKIAIQKSKVGEDLAYILKNI
ncbi:MAG: hypothetical protein JW734_06330 [Candidatus Omnitrophica bacterium]|nr:hypothetical protein [Candidatus Omnitrophota bacterium]